MKIAYVLSTFAGIWAAFLLCDCGGSMPSPGPQVPDADSPWDAASPPPEPFVWDGSFGCNLLDAGYSLDEQPYEFEGKQCIWWHSSGVPVDCIKCP